MNKTLRVVALATASLCASFAASAQSSVQAYGLMDVSIGSYKAPGATTRDKAVNSGDMTTSFFGFRGNEDLGGGISAVFALEHFMRPDTGEAGRFTGDAFWARSAFVGLKGGFGTTTLGRHTTPFFVSTLLFNPLGDSFTFSPSILHYYQVGGSLVGDSGWSNSISYSSPDLNGLSLNLLAGEGTGGRNYGGNALFFKGKFSATLAAQRVNVGFEQDAIQLGAAYDFGFAKAYGQIGQVKNDVAGVSNKTDIYQLGASAPLGKGSLLGSYGHSALKVAGFKTTRKSATIGYDYNLSKRTDVYAAYLKDSISTLAPSGSSYAVGVRHKF